MRVRVAPRHEYHPCTETCAGSRRREGCAIVLTDRFYLARVNAIQTPAWALKEDRVLDDPWFSEELPGVRLLLLRDTPSAFKDKNVFVFDSALKVA